MSVIVFAAIVTGWAVFALMWPHNSLAAIAVTPFAASFAAFAASLAGARRAPVPVDVREAAEVHDSADLMVAALRSMADAAARYDQPSNPTALRDGQVQVPGRSVV